MIECTFFDEHGSITYVAELSPETYEHYLSQGPVPHLTTLGNPDTQYVVNNQLVDYTPEEIAAKRSLKQGWAWKMPERMAVFVASLDDLKASKNAEINSHRLKANRSFFMFANKQIACDELSRSDIDAVNGVVSLLNVVPVTQWKAIDNTYVSIPDKPTWIQFYMAMVQQGQQNFDYAQSLKAQLADATTVEQVNAIQWQN